MTALMVFAALVLVVVLQPVVLADLLARTLPGILWRVNTAEPLVALTFDDGPSPAYTPQVLGILARHNVRATFFLAGENARQYPELVRQIRDAAGHEVRNHTSTMATTFFLGSNEFEKDLLLAEAELEMGSAHPKFLCPAGGWIRPKQLRLAKSNRYICVLGSAYAYDPYRPPAGYIR